jgi:hypothetical protein
MPQYHLCVCNQRNGIKYSEGFDLPDIDAARDVARWVAKVFMEVVPYWNNLSTNQQDDFRVEIVDEASERLLRKSCPSVGYPTDRRRQSQYSLSGFQQTSGQHPTRAA